MDLSLYYSTIVFLRPSACSGNVLLRRCCINSSQLHQTPGEMERHSAALADGQANIQNNNQQISVTSPPFSSPLPPPFSLALPFVCVYRHSSDLCKYRYSIWTDVLIYFERSLNSMGKSVHRKWLEKQHLCCVSAQDWPIDFYITGLSTQTSFVHCLLLCVQIMHHSTAFAHILIMCEWNQDTMHVYAYDMSVCLNIQVTEYMHRGHTHIALYMAFYLNLYQIMFLQTVNKSNRMFKCYSENNWLTVYIQQIFFTVKYCLLN